MAAVQAADDHAAYMEQFCQGAHSWQRDRAVGLEIQVVGNVGPVMLQLAEGLIGRHDCCSWRELLEEGWLSSAARAEGRQQPSDAARSLTDRQRSDEGHTLVQNTAVPMRNDS